MKVGCLVTVGSMSSIERDVKKKVLPRPEVERSFGLENPAHCPSSRWRGLFWWLAVPLDHLRGLKDHESPFLWLRKSLDERADYSPWISAPNWIPFAMTRFQDLLRRRGLPQ